MSYLKEVSLFPGRDDAELNRLIEVSDGERTVLFTVTEIRKARSDLRAKTWTIIGLAISGLFMGLTLMYIGSTVPM